MLSNERKQSISTGLTNVIRHDRDLKNLQLPPSHLEQRSILGDLLIESNFPYPEETLVSVDRIWTQEMKEMADRGEITTVEEIPKTHVLHGTKLAIWRGDITKLRIDGIVNAANDQGLGCFQPEHKCIDNVIHRAAGPRLRIACREQMKSRMMNDNRLSAGSSPIVTPSFHLPSKRVIHATGPHVHGKVQPFHREQLSKVYENALSASAEHGLKSVALCCISTGLFGYPKEQAAAVAIETVRRWIERNPNSLETIIFDVYTDDDELIYKKHIDGYFLRNPVWMETEPERSIYEHDMHRLGVLLSKKYLDEADAVLVVAGAGMSVKEGEMVYVKPEDFKKHYPWFTKWGYKTSYECMGLIGDPSVPITAKWALWAYHMDNMGWKFAPNEGYSQLKKLVKDKDTFVLTSNVDRLFERSGFPTNRIYTPQGEWTYVQCNKPCRPEAFFDARGVLDKILPHVSEDGHIPKSMVPKCPHCGGNVFGNVRAGRNFIHHEHYQQQNDAVRHWMKDKVEKQKKVVVIEIGAGFNTPMVTRFPAEAFVRELGHNGTLIRINPSDPEVPSDLKAVSFAHGWQVLGEILNTEHTQRELDEKKLRKFQVQNGRTQVSSTTYRIGRYFGHFDWNAFIEHMKD